MIQSNWFDLYKIYSPLVLKVFSLLGLAVYFFFTLIVFKQVKIMSQSIKDKLNHKVILISTINLFIPIILFLVVFFF